LKAGVREQGPRVRSQQCVTGEEAVIPAHAGIQEGSGAGKRPQHSIYIDPSNGYADLLPSEKGPDISFTSNIPDHRLIRG
jgi:hypothetical protein